MTRNLWKKLQKIKNQSQYSYITPGRRKNNEKLFLNGQEIFREPLFKLGISLSITLYIYIDTHIYIYIYIYIAVWGACVSMNINKIHIYHFQNIQMPIRNVSLKLHHILETAITSIHTLTGILWWLKYCIRHGENSIFKRVQ